MQIEVDDEIAGILVKEAKTKGISTNTLIGKLLGIRYQEFKAEIKAGFDDLDANRFSNRKAEDIAKAVLSKL